ncbi:MAG: ATP-binding protein [Roseivirga sp.]|nr:ATP-binding protein [Roseivirga sp.]
MKTTHCPLSRSILLCISLSGLTSTVFAQQLTLLWETPTQLPGVESVIYHPQTNVIYAANIIGHFMAKDGNGSIAKISLDGQIIDPEWVTGLDAPTGLGIHKGKLYVTDIDRLVEIDITKAEISNTWPVQGAKAFNDIAIGADGTVYVSDTGGDAVYALKSGSITKVLSNVRGPNGLLEADGKFLMVLWYAQALYSVDLKSAQLMEIATGIANPDGIESVGNGGFLLTGLNGLIYYLDENGQKTLLADTSGDQIQAADIDYIPSKKLLLVPTLNSDKVMAYRLEL